MSTLSSRTWQDYPYPEVLLGAVLEVTGGAIRLVTWWPDRATAQDVGARLCRYLLANLWGHHGALGAVWVHDRATGADVVMHERRGAEVDA